MKLLFFFSIIALLFTTQVYGYLAERSAPFEISIYAPSSSAEHNDGAPIIVRHGDKVDISWTLSDGVRFPLYGYASAKTSKTDVGLLPIDSTRTEAYTYTIDNSLPIRDYAYRWVVSDDVPVGRYRLGIGFFYHEASSQEIHVIAA